MNYPTLRTIIATSLLLWLTIISVSVARQLPPTSDEYTFVPSGYSYWKTGDFRMNTEQPPLLKLIGTLPLFFLDIDFPDDHPSWKHATLFGDDGFYKTFVFHRNNTHKETMLFLPRLTTVIISLLLGALLLIWGTELWGPWGGVLTLALYVVEPTVLAYSSLFMMDLGLTFFMTLAFYALWKFVKKPTPTTWTFAAITFGLVQLTKYTAVMLFGIYPFIFAALLLSKKIIPPPIFRKRPLVFSAISYGGMVFVALLFINLSYGFQGTFQTAQDMFENDPNIDKTFYTPDKLFGQNKYTNWIAHNLPLPLPYHYVKGFGYVLVEAKAERQVYLFGKFSPTGFWYYYILSYLVKTTLPVLLLLFVALITFFQTKKDLRNEIILVIPILAYLFLFSINQKQIGIRHVLQVYPFIFLFIARLARKQWFFTTLGVVFIATIIALAGIDAVRTFPDYISYANQFIGLNNGYLYFSDTNVDILQNIDKAITFIKQNPTTKSAMTNADILPEYVSVQQAASCAPGLFIADVHAMHSQKYKWLVCNQPIKRLGRTLFVYNVTTC